MTSPPVPAVRLTTAALTLVALKFVALVLTAALTPYEFHRDEFLYAAMGTHLALFRMDFPPLIALLAEALRGLGADTLFGFRMVPALAGTAVMLLAVVVARELGGGRVAQAVTALAILVNPLFLRTSALFQPVVLDQFWWLLGCYALVRLERTGEERWWLLLGVAGGLGLLSKFSILFFGLAVLAGLLLTARRRAFLGPWPWAALAIALLLGAPSVIGQVLLDFPVREQMASLARGQLARVSVGEFLTDQVMWGPAACLLGVAGLAALLLAPSFRRFRMLGWVAAAAFALFVAAKGKSYYVGPIYPMLFAAGAVQLERVARPRLRTALLWGFTGLTVAYAPLSIPFGLPIVPPEPMARYAASLGIGAATRTNWGAQLTLPQDYADMLGWREKAEAVAAAYRQLSPAEQAEAVLYGGNYGQAGALELYGRRMGLPPVVSLAGSFYLFGPGTRPGRVVIFLGVERDDITDLRCGSLEEVTRVRNAWAVPGEDDVPVVVCKNPALTIQEVWRRERPQWG